MNNDDKTVPNWIVSLTNVKHSILRIEDTKINGKQENKATQKHVQNWDRQNIETHPKWNPNPLPNPPEIYSKSTTPFGARNDWNL